MVSRVLHAQMCAGSLRITNSEPHRKEPHMGIGVAILITLIGTTWAIHGIETMPGGTGLPLDGREPLK